MNRTTMIAAFAGLSLSTAAQSQTSKVDPLDPAKQPVPGATPGPGLAAKPKPPLKPAIVDLQDAAKQPRKRTPRAPLQPVPSPSVAPAPEPSPAPVQPVVPIQVGPEGPSAEKPAPAPGAAQPAAAEPTVTNASGQSISIVPAPVNAAPQPAITTAATGTTETPATNGIEIDIDSVAALPAKGALRPSPVEIGAQVETRSARQVTAIQAPTRPTDGLPVEAPVAAGGTAAVPAGTVYYDQSVPNPAAALLPPAPAQGVLSPTFVQNWPSGKAVTEPATPAETTPATVAAPETPAVAPAPAPAPSLTHAVTPDTTSSAPAAAPAVTAPTVVTSAPPSIAPPPIAPAPVAPAVVSAQEPVSTPRTDPAPTMEKPAVVSVEAPRPLDVQPAPEPLPPAAPPVAAPTPAMPAPVSTTPAGPAHAEPSRVVEPPPVLVPAPAVVPAPPTIAVEAVKPIDANVQGVVTPDTAKEKIVHPAVVETPVESPQPTAAPVQVEPAPAAPLTPVPVGAAPTEPAPTPATVPAPAIAEPAAAATAEPVALKVLSLTGTPGMVQWQLDGGSQWLIPELDESTKARFIVRTGPDAGVEVLLDESTRVRLGRFSRAEVRNLASDGRAGQLSISLLRGVVYVVPGKGKSVSVQTPQRTVLVKEPTQITHDNGGTRMVSFTEQPNPGTTAGVPSANP